jgi:hypothetical protein
VVTARRLAHTLAVALLALSTTAAGPHVLHTSLAQLTYDPARRELTVSLRVFTDDFTATVAQLSRTAIKPGTAASDSVMARYAATRFALAEASGRPVRLAWCGVRATADVLLICLRGPTSVAPSGATLRNAILMERFADQVNIVQSTTAGGRHTTLFTRGNERKRLP